MLFPSECLGVVACGNRKGNTGVVSAPDGRKVAVSQTHPDADARVRVAVFDLDGTLLDGQSGTLVLRYLLRRDLVSGRSGTRAAWWGVRYKLHLPYRQSEVREIIFRDLRRLSPERIGQVMRQFHDEVMVPRYFPQGVEELHRRRDEGELTVIVSATFDAIAQAAREHLGADVALATIMERGEDGRYTGRVQGEVTAGEEKLRRLRAYADERFGPDGWVLSHAYGDHYTDAPLLEAALCPTAVNAGPTLRREAERRGWPLVSWE